MARPPCGHLFGGAPHGGLFAFRSRPMEFSGNGWSGEQGEGAPAAPPRREHLVVIGNGMAGCRAVEELLARDSERYRITIFGAEPHVNYNRIMLSPVLAGEKAFEDIVLNTREWYRDNGIDLVAG